MATVELPGGTVFDQYVMRTPRGAMTVVLDDDAERVLLIWRHRFVTGQWLWELPGRGADRTGTPDPNETEAVRWIPLAQLPGLIKDRA
jgi:8-oxo-dGTP pyrophosphatase MutT (NUDIX family)